MNYQRLVDEVAETMGVSTVPVVEEATGNAATDLKSIFINPKFAGEVAGNSGEDGVRFVLAHELGHVHSPSAGHGHEGEHEADRWAARAIARMGATFHPVTAVMSHLNAHSTTTHPAASSREGVAKEAFLSSGGDSAERVSPREQARSRRPAFTSPRPKRLARDGRSLPRRFSRREV